MNNLSLSVFMPVIISFLISVVFCPILIPFLRKLKFGQTEREEGPQSHLKKNGTPTMGGLVILASILLTSLIYIGKFTEILPVLFMTLGFGLIGFLDDYIKVVKKRSLGLTPLQKMALQFIVTGVFIYYYFKIAGLDTSIKIPFVSGDGFVMPTWLFIIFVFIVVLGTVNGVNFTDGLDGLASGVTVIVATFFTIAALSLNPSMTPITGAVVGSLLGFLLFNTYPARVFMGDTGSLALGGLFAALSIATHTEFLAIILGGLFVIETMSDIIQVGYFKMTHKRVFKMAPIHHHFELKGWPEVKVVVRFWMIEMLFVLIALVLFYGDWVARSGL